MQWLMWLMRRTGIGTSAVRRGTLTDGAPRRSPRATMGLMRHGVCNVLAGVLGVWLGLVGHPAAAQGSRPQVRFSDIVATNAAEYTNYQVKFTYTGIQSMASPSLLLAGAGRATNENDFKPYRSPGIHYGNDDIRVFRFNVAGATIQKFINGLAERRHLQTSGGPPEPMLSLMIERGLPPNDKVFEHLATPIEASEIINLLQGATRSEPPGTRDIIRRFRNYTVGPN